MKIKALVPFSTGTISMEQYEVREVTDSLGNELISAGIAVEIGGGGLPPVTPSDAGKVLGVNDSGVWVAANPSGGGGSGGGELVEIKTDTSYASATCSHTKEQLDAIREAKGIVNAVITVQDGKGFFSHLPAMFMPNYTGSGYEYNISAVRWSSSNMSDFKLRKIVANVSTLGNVTISKANQT